MVEPLMDVVMVVLMLVIYGALFLFLIANYVLNGLAWFKVAKKEGLQTPVLAWIPVADNLIVGGIASQIDREDGKERNWGKLLLILFIAAYAGIMVGYGIFIIAMIGGVALSAASEAFGVIVLFGGMLIFYVGIFAAAMAGQAANYLRGICAYKYFEKIAPDKLLKYMLLYFMVPLAGPILIMKAIKNEEDDYVEIEVPAAE